MQHTHYDPEENGCSYHRPLLLGRVVDVGHGGTHLNLVARSCVPSHSLVDDLVVEVTVAIAAEVVFSRRIVSWQNCSQLGNDDYRSR